MLFSSDAEWGKGSGIGGFFASEYLNLMPMRRAPCLPTRRCETLPVDADHLIADCNPQDVIGGGGAVIG